MSCTNNILPLSLSSRPQNQALHHTAHRRRRLRAVNLIRDLPLESLETLKQLGTITGILRIQLHKHHANLDAHAHVPRIDNVIARPLEHRLHRPLIAPLKRLPHSRPVPQRKQQRQHAERRVILAARVQRLVQRARVPPVTERLLPRLLLGRAGARVLRDNDLGLALAQALEAAHGRGFTLLAFRGLVVLVEGAGEEGGHFAVALLLAGGFGAREAGADGEDAGLHAHDEVTVRAVERVGGRENAEGEDGGGVLCRGDDVPASGLEYLDVAVEAARHEAGAVGSEAEGGDGLLVVGDLVDGAGGDEVEDGDLGARGGEEGGAGGQGENGLDGGGVLEGHDGGVGTYSRVPDLDGRVVRARDDDVAGARGGGGGEEFCAADVVGVSRERVERVVGGEVPEADRLVVGGGEQGGGLGAREARGPDGLAVLRPCLEDRAGVGVEHLHAARILGGDENAAVAAQGAGAGDVGEAGDCLFELAGAGGVELDAGAGGNGKETIGGGRRDVSDWVRGRRGDLELVLEGLPVALLGRHGGRSRGQLHLREGSHGSCHCDMVV